MTCDITRLEPRLGTSRYLQRKHDVRSFFTRGLMASDHIYDVNVISILRQALETDKQSASGVVLHRKNKASKSK
jgi:hypothetical protein